jgi:hypothetical protein
MRAVLLAQINKTDHNDARSIGQMMRAGLYHPAHVKTLVAGLLAFELFWSGRMVFTISSRNSSA